MPRILAIDVGEKRIGIAISDPLNILAQPFDTIEKKNIGEVLEKLKAVIKENEVGKVVVGMPYNMDGTEGIAAKNVKVFTDLLKKELRIDIETLDERLTTKESERILLEADISRKKRRHSIDKMAAMLILQKYLDLHVQKS